MNTRIQVEHAITEEVTEIDIVREMIRIAAGRPLAYRQSDVTLHGHAIEARIYAEDPDKEFPPSPGTITAYRAPEGPGLRVDSGVVEGSVVSIHYDAMLAKLIAWGRIARRRSNASNAQSRTSGSRGFEPRFRCMQGFCSTLIFGRGATTPNSCRSTSGRLETHPRAPLQSGPASSTS